MEKTLETARLRLVATTLEHIEAELRSPGLLGPMLGVAIPEDWPPGEYDRDALDYFRGKLTAGGPSEVGWYGWYALTRDSDGRMGRLVAAAGYLGPPVDGAVEVGYSVLPSARGRGYAVEIVEALVASAFGDPAVREVIAHTSDSNPASTKVLLKCGFQRAGDGREPGTVQYRRKLV